MKKEDYVCIKYREKESIGIDNKEFWYQDLKFALGDNDFVILDEIFVEPFLRNKGIGSGIIKDFISQHKNSIILVHAGALKTEYPVEPTIEEHELILDRLSNFYTKLGFKNINKYSYSYEFSDIYVYIGNNVGKDFYEKVRDYYSDYITTQEFISFLKSAVKDLTTSVVIDICSNKKLPYYIGFIPDTIYYDTNKKVNVITNTKNRGLINPITVNQIVNDLKRNPDALIKFEVYDNLDDYKNEIAIIDTFVDRFSLAITKNNDREIRIMVSEK